MGLPWDWSQLHVMGTYFQVAFLRPLESAPTNSESLCLVRPCELTACARVKEILPRLSENLAFTLTLPMETLIDAHFGPIKRPEIICVQAPEKPEP